MSESVSKTENKYRYVIFHGEDVRTKRFQKKINRKPTLTKVILTNSIIILGIIIVVSLLANFYG